MAESYINTAQNIYDSFNTQTFELSASTNNYSGYLKALEDIEWSRGYCWDVRLDSVPEPFHKTGPIGLPCISATIDLVEVSNKTFDIAMDQFSVPLRRGLGQVTLTLIDDEVGTISMFFERWCNCIYNSYRGVVPVQEAIKQISIKKLTGARDPVKRNIYSYDDSRSSVDSYELLVFPSSKLQENFSDNSDVRNYSITLDIVEQLYSDYGSPSSKDANAPLHQFTRKDVRTKTNLLNSIGRWFM